eukprot:12750970-Ditylum_brightwellii.AAC.1
MACDVMPESKSAKNDDTSSTELSVDDRWKGYTMRRITNVLKNPFGGHWLISCSMYDAGDEFTSFFFRKLDFVQQCHKNPKCLGLLKDYADEHQEVLSFYYGIEEIILDITTDDNS